MTSRTEIEIDEVRNGYAPVSLVVPHSVKQIVQNIHWDYKVRNRCHYEDKQLGG